MERLVVIILTTLAVVQHGTAIDTVPQLNISQYLGRWYQVYGNLVVDTFTERNCKCVTADYGAFPNKSISVKNACRLKAPDGELSTIEGYAFRPNEKEEGKLKVVFGVVPRLFQLGGANYWVVQLGPPTYNGNQYQYAVVSNRWKFSLFVLARDVAEFKAKYDAEVTAKLEEQGFTKFYNKPTETYQGSDCQYI